MMPSTKPTTMAVSGEPTTMAVSGERPRLGVWLVDKPVGLSSAAVVAMLRKRHGVKKAGHAGTLDPLASGLLPVLADDATKLAGLWLHDEKEYVADVAFGATSATDDAEGPIVPTGIAPVAPGTDIEPILAHFRGPQRQKPPSFSAIKTGGRRAYDLARRGEPPDLEERDIDIRELTGEGWTAEGHLRLRIRCSGGTYIRSLARDIGDAIGCGAYLAALRRTAIGRGKARLGVESARSLVELLSPDAALADTLTPLHPAWFGLPTVVVSRGDWRGLAQGMPCEASGSGPDGAALATLVDGQVVALVRLGADASGMRWIRPQRMLVMPEGD